MCSFYHDEQRKNHNFSLLTLELDISLKKNPVSDPYLSVTSFISIQTLATVGLFCLLNK